MERTDDRPIRICLAGASPDTGNLGVSALSYAALRGILTVSPEANVTVLDEGRGRRESLFNSNGRSFRHQLCGERLSRRVWQAESLWNIQMSLRMGRLGNKTARALSEADAVLDVSGGDSFTDLYGPKRFAAVTMLKRMMLQRGIPLVLLPQTYGPFHDPERRRLASEIAAGAAAAWARDERSFAALKELLGNQFDPDRHHCGVDMAFDLEARQAPTSVQEPLERFAAKHTQLFGLNVSGLLFNAQDGGSAQYKLKADYRDLILGFARRLLTQSQGALVLVPHVITEVGHFESDVAACDAVARELVDVAGDRVLVLPAMDDPRQVKWAIAQMQWFCGTRMHSTIAALSSGVPTAAVAYSLKTAGVFESCGLSDCVVDPRELDTADAIDALCQCWQRRAITATTLAEYLPRVCQRAVEQMRLILGAVAPESMCGQLVGARSS